MSRRKQSNPKPFNKGDCSETTEEMTVDSRDSKDLNPNELADEKTQTHAPQSPIATDETDVEMKEMRESPTAEQLTAPTSTYPKMSSPNTKQTAEGQSSPSSSISNERNSPDSTRNTLEFSAEVGKQEIDDDLGEHEKSNASVSPRLKGKTPTVTTTPSPTRHLQTELATSISPTNILPKLRLNALLASDPALKPDAKDLGAMHAESQSKQHNLKMAAAALSTHDDLDAMRTTKVNALVEPAADLAPRMKVFMCLPCGIGFSSPSTLEAHQAYYCSHRKKDVTDEHAVEKTAASNASAATATSTSVPSIANTGASISGTEPSSKAIKTGKQYACTQCSYSADKKVSLNRHMRMHQTSPATSSNGGGGGVAGSGLDECSSQQSDRYCSDCDIIFNKVKTYRAHKQNYCVFRRQEGQLTPKPEVTTTSAAKTPNLGGAISPQIRSKTPTPAVSAAAAAASMQLQPQPFLALPTNPILIVPYSLIRAASLIPGPLTTATSGFVNPETTCFTLDNGSLKPLATALNISSTASSNSAPVSGTQTPLLEAARLQQLSSNDSLLTEKNAVRSMEVSEPTAKRKEGSVRESTPLDLSLRRSPIAAMLQRQRLSTAAGFLDHERLETLFDAHKENLSLDESGSITPEQIVCAPSLPNSPSMSPSPKRRAISPRSSGSTSSMSPPVNPTSATIAAAAAAAAAAARNANIALLSADDNVISSLMAKKSLELALKLSSRLSSSMATSSGHSPAELAAAAVAVANKSSLMGLPVMHGPAENVGKAGAGGQPQIYVKQGESKCIECNIVFYQHENYLVHKQHYCSARNQNPTENDEKVSNTPPLTNAASTAEASPVAYQQLICAPCGLKYTLLDNLRAHQKYYCPKRSGAASSVGDAGTASGISSPAVVETAQLTLPKEKCSKCKTMHKLGLPCPPPPATLQHQQTTGQITNATSGNQNVYKCPICDAVSLTATESRKHMETHGTIKAFRCSICRYKGNTLRGMRTHIRMHFDKKTSDFNEEHYMSCILEDEGIEIPSAATINQEQLAQQIAVVQQQQQLQQAVAAGLQQHHQQQQQQQQQQEQQQYNRTALRHMKRAHMLTVNTNASPMLSPEACNPELDANTDANSLNGDNGTHIGNFTIKTEPLEQQTTATVANTATANTANVMLSHDNNNSPAPHELLPHIKAEPLDIAMTQQLHSPVSSIDAMNTTSAAAAADENVIAAAHNQKYCHTCDIPFKYMNNYLAHKQFYCKNKIGRPDANSDSPSPNAAASMMVVQTPPANAMLLQKNNKENLQQEAAI